MAIIHFAVGRTDEHSGHLAERDSDSIWCNENPSGWTYQDITGAHGDVLYEGPSKEEAQSALDKWLECDAEAKGTYCYTHNRIQS